jgi:hypothetical protein
MLVPIAFCFAARKSTVNEGDKAISEVFVIHPTSTHFGGCWLFVFGRGDPSPYGMAALSVGVDVFGDPERQTEQRDAREVVPYKKSARSAQFVSACLFTFF